LTYLATAEDARNPTYQTSLREANRDAERVRELADSPQGIPSGGAAVLLRSDPFTQGPKLFARNCASCHRYNGRDGTGRPIQDPETASDLAGFASRPWLAGFLDPNHISATNYFGATKFKDGKMAKFVKKDVAGYTAAQKEQLTKVIAAISAEAKLKAQVSADQRDAAMILEGRVLLRDSMKCTDCHQFHAKDEEATAPDLTGYGSRDWLLKFIGNPAHPDFYGELNDRMPAFGEKRILSAEQIGLLVDWLRGEWYEPQPGIETATAK
jgi:ubiquinol-cytochrome c reductase cytochrome b subunit